MTNKTNFFGVYKYSILHEAGFSNKELNLVSMQKTSMVFRITSSIFFVGFVGLLFIGCQETKQTTETFDLQQDTFTVKKVDTNLIIERTETKYLLALSHNALQLINQNNGSTTSLGFGLPFERMIETVEKVLEMKPTIGGNSECGAGPLKMATWDNGLTLFFQEKNKIFEFVGWGANEAQLAEKKLKTMAGIGVGSTRKEMESAYVISVVKTSLGYEFSTKSDDLFGIFEGVDENARITNMWSGTSCNFR